MPIDLNTSLTEEGALISFSWVPLWVPEWVGFQGTHSAVPGTDLPKCFASTNGQVASLRNYSFGEKGWIITLGDLRLLLISEQKIQTIWNWESISVQC